MQTVFPEHTGSSGLFLVGYRRAAVDPINFAEHLFAEHLGVIIVKRKYQRVGEQLLPVDDNKDIKLSDEIEDIVFDGDTVSLNFYESELAVFKPKPDLIWLRFPANSTTYRIKHCDSSGLTRTWLQRTASGSFDTNVDADAAQHVFGWLPKTISPRIDFADFSVAPPIPAPDIPNLSTFQNEFFNAHRLDFAQAAYANQPLQRGDQFIYTSMSDAADESSEVEQFRFTLPDAAPDALLYYFKGEGKDELIRWKITQLDNFQLDTLVVDPTDEHVYAIWRAVWPFQDIPTERYRQLLVRHNTTQGVI